MTVNGAWLPIVVMLSGIGAALAVLKGHLYLTKRFHRRRFPFEDRALRPPGEALRDQIESQKLDFMGELAMVLVVPMLLYGFYLQARATDGLVKPGSPYLYTVLGVASVMWLLWRMVTRLRRVTRLRIGYAGEVTVGESLNQLMLQGYRVFHDVPGDKAFNVDHVVVGPAGVFAVETKTRTKKESREGKAEYKVVYDGKTLGFEGDAGRSYTDFLDQTRRNAEWLSSWLGKATGETVATRGVLVLPGWYVERTGRGDVLVMSHKQVKSLPKVSCASKLSPEQIQRIAHQLEQRCRNIELMPKIMRREKRAFT